MYPRQNQPAQMQRKPRAERIDRRGQIVAGVEAIGQGMQHVGESPVVSSPARARSPPPSGSPALASSATRVANSVASSTESFCDTPKMRGRMSPCGLSPCQTKQREGFHPFVLRFIADKSDEWASPTEQPIAYGIETRRSMPCCTAMLVASIAASHPPRLANPLRPLRVLRGPSSRLLAPTGPKRGLEICRSF